MDLKVAVGISQLEDSKEAGRAAVLEAISLAKISEPSFLFVFAAPSYKHQELLDGITEVTNSPLIGGTTAGEISTHGYTQNSVVVMDAVERNDVFTRTR